MSALREKRQGGKQHFYAWKTTQPVFYSRMGFHGKTSTESFGQARSITTICMNTCDPSGGRKRRVVHIAIELAARALARQRRVGFKNSSLGNLLSRNKRRAAIPPSSVSDFAVSRRPYIQRGQHGRCWRETRTRTALINSDHNLHGCNFNRCVLLRVAAVKTNLPRSTL